MVIERIELQKMINTRDLGGFSAADGRRVKNGRLIRSGQLSDGTESDLNFLFEILNVKTVFDLRTEAEALEKPEPKRDGVDFIKVPLLDSSFLGIARDEYSMEAWLNMFRDSDLLPEKIFSDMYEKLIFSKGVRDMIKGIFSVLLENREGALLWHCSAGKDRAGIVTALVLMSLGVSREDITDDYMMTGEFSKKVIRKMQIFMPLKIHDKKVRDCINVLFGVRREYMENIFSKIDRDFGGTDAFLSESFGLGEGERNELAKIYLL